MRNARHAYFAIISYVDDWVGELVDTLETRDARQHGGVFSADHGDMLGERGLWYKMNFFEGACRIPLMVAGPGIAATVADEHVSLLDVMPTCSTSPEWNTPELADGASVRARSCCGDREPDRTVYGEYFGRGCRRADPDDPSGTYKFVFCEADPPQLYDLAPIRTNWSTCARAAARRTVAAFEAEVYKRWRPAEIRAEVIASQHARRTVDGRCAKVATCRGTPADRRRVGPVHAQPSRPQRRRGLRRLG